MDISVSMWSVEKAARENGVNQFDFIDWCEEQKVRNVELVSCYMKENEPEKVKKYLDNKAMRVSCYTIMTNMVGPSDKDWNTFDYDLSVANKLNAPFVRVVGGEFCGTEAESARKSIIDNLKIAVGKARKYGIVLVLENVGPYTGRAADVKEIIDSVDSPYLKVNFDVANCLLVEEDALDSFKLLQNDIAYVHMKDFIEVRAEQIAGIEPDDRWKVQPSTGGINFVGCVITEGVSPCLKLRDLLIDSGYDGYLSIEYEGLGDFPETQKSLTSILVRT